MQAYRSEHPDPGSGREEGIALGGLVALLIITSAWWALALWPVHDGPAWLERTRYACFGVAESGLPDAGGWIGLIAGPLGMLGILLAGWGRGFRGLVQRARGSRTLAAALLTMAVAAVLLLGGAGLRVHQVRAANTFEGDGSLPPSTYPRLDQASPALSLTAQDGATVDLAAFRGRPVLVTFAYAHCTTVCPLIVKHSLDAQALRTAEGERPVVLIVTLDPWRDPPSRLPAMAKGWSLPDTDAYVLSGDVDAVESVLDDWQVPRMRNVSNGDVTHPSLLYVIDPAGRIAFASNGGAEAIATLLRRL